MAIIQHNSEPIERGEFTGCRLELFGEVRDSSFAIWPDDKEVDEWYLGSVEAIDDLIDMLKELRKVDESDCA